MEIFITLLAAVALIPAVLFLYGSLSQLVQLLFNKNFNEEQHQTKWRLNTASAYTLLLLCTLSFVNMFTIDNQSVDVMLSYGMIAVAYWYLGSLIKYHFKNLIAKLN